MFCEADRGAQKVGLSQAQGDVALLHLLIRGPQKVLDELPVDSGLSRLGRVRLPGNQTNAVEHAIGAATASRRLILLLTGQETVTPHFAPRAARTAERSVVDIAPL